ncbi:HD domain-containing protein [Geodermatophilus aquaeductus]|uniref:HD domain-containing protein n=1 Tax=Geodermatophilus aquaeductus TaxID=1564161 RepID=A0A521DN27_9ACTN|nr:hypothetical protein [Geodermatophilus aquaeductus]SMO73012.1 HD domain-containing protein [Geodermatophilus aquaeductus]
MSPSEAAMLRARELAVHAHHGQVDEAGLDYFRAHVADVARRVGDDPVLRTVAYLHDVVEDTAVSLEELAARHFSEQVLAAVDALTFRPHEARVTYYARVRADPVALAVELADIASNTDPDRMALLDHETRTRLRRRYIAALPALLQHAGPR